MKAATCGKVKGYEYLLDGLHYTNGSTRPPLVCEKMFTIPPTYPTFKTSTLTTLPGRWCEPAVMSLYLIGGVCAMPQ